MINYKASKYLFLKIYPDENLQELLEGYIKRQEKKFERQLKSCYKNNWKPHLKKDPFTKLALIYAFLPEVKSRYEKKGIEDEIFFDTMSDIEIWINDCRDNLHKVGLDELNWLQLHMKLEIFKIGRLQYQKTICYIPKKYDKNGESVMLGDKILNVHIPRGEKLDIEECEKSFVEAQKFFAKYFPEFPNNKFMCISWLLYPENHKFMREGSNILKFPALFDKVVWKLEEPAGAYRWLFSVRYKNKEMMKNKRKTGSYGSTDDLPQNSSLQQRAVEYIKNGGSLGEGFGVKIL